MFGTFDISNFGDILFPIVAEEMFRRTGESVDLVRYSYRQRSARGWHYDVRPIERFEFDLAETDLVLVGGGHLIHANASMAPDYFPVDKSLPHPFGFWWLPAMAARLAGVPVAFHAPSVDATIPEWSRPLFESFAQCADYPNARDVRSREILTTLGAKEAVLVPDSIFSIDCLVARGCPSEPFVKFMSDHELRPPYLIVQPSASLRKERGEVDRLISEAHERQWQVLELPIFQEKLNRTGLFSNNHRVTAAKYNPGPQLLAEIIANAHGVVGVSLHLSIVACVFGVPVYRKAYSRDSKFILLDELRANIQYLDESPVLREIAGVPDPKIAEFQQRLREHYNRLVQLARLPGALTREARAWDLLKRVPNALRGTQSQTERLADFQLRLRRARNFASARLAVPIDRVSALVSRRK